jgi:hypothetical protein
MLYEHEMDHESFDGILPALVVDVPAGSGHRVCNSSEHGSAQILNAAFGLVCVVSGIVEAENRALVFDARAGRLLFIGHPLDNREKYADPLEQADRIVTHLRVGVEVRTSLAIVGDALCSDVECAREGWNSPDQLLKYVVALLGRTSSEVGRSGGLLIDSLTRS